MKYLWAVAAIFISFQVASSEGLSIGLGIDYTPIARIKYVDSNLPEYEVVDNVSYTGRLSCFLGNSFRYGLVIGHIGKKIHPVFSGKEKLSIWQTSISGDYSYNLFESGSSRMLFGIDIGYARLNYESGSATVSAPALTLAGLTGIKFGIAKRLWGEVDYRFGYQKFDIDERPHREITFSNSSLRLGVEYKILGKAEDR